MKTITCEELKQKIDNHENMLILDVRSPAEFRAGHIDAAVNLPLHVLPLTIEQRTPDKDTYIVCCCQAGGRSAQATQFLEQHGYRNVVNLSGGYGEYCMSI